MSRATAPAAGQPGALPATGQRVAPVTFEGRRWRRGLSFHIKRHALTDIGGELREPAGSWRRPQGARERRRLAVAGHAEHRAEYQPEQPANHREGPSARPVRAALRPASPSGSPGCCPPRTRPRRAPPPPRPPPPRPPPPPPPP